MVFLSQIVVWFLLILSYINKTNIKKVLIPLSYIFENKILILEVS